MEEVFFLILKYSDFNLVKIKIKMIMPLFRATHTLYSSASHSFDCEIKFCFNFYITFLNLVQ